MKQVVLSLSSLSPTWSRSQDVVLNWSMDEIPLITPGCTGSNHWFIMRPSSPPSSSSSSVTSAETARPETQLLSSSSSPPPPHLSLQSPELQAEFLQGRRNRFRSHGDFSESNSSSPSPPDSRQARLSLSSPELLSELKEARTRPLRHVPAHNGLTTVFSGRGGQGSGPAPSTGPANQRTSR
ncbi:espin-like isoform X2 [Trachinotus anak]|uniref:espin-like isoform X2 n=1 Tax=Trachinotus anak TaxID=443729 RepID=UPI0039F1AE9B